MKYCAKPSLGARRFALSVEARQGNFLGLLSISSAAEKDQGYPRMSHKGTDFFMAVMLKN